MNAEKPKDKSKTHPMSGSDILVKVLGDQDIEFIFGYPGGAVLPIFDAFYKSGVHNILPRHEQGAVHSAEGYAKATGKTGVVCVTSGPGVANTVTGIADAMIDSVPLVVLSGQVTTSAIGTNAFQELDIINITRPITKASMQVKDLSELESTVNQAFELAQSGRKGPVLVDLPKDIMGQEYQHESNSKVDLAKQNSLSNTQAKQLAKVVEALGKAKKPVVLIGGGVAAANSSKLAREFIDRFSLPVVATLLGLGVIPEDDPLYIGMGGMHGNYAANMALHECDFLLNIGSRFDDRLVPNYAGFAPNAKIAHIDIDPNELGKVVRVDYPVVADAKLALEYLLNSSLKMNDISSWLDSLKTRKREHPFNYQKDDNQLKPQEVIEEVGKVTHGDALVVTDVGQHQMWAAQFYPFRHPNQFITSGGLGTMGFGIPAAIGAHLSDPKKDVVLFVGDGGFQMTSEELEVIGENQFNIKIFLMNNQTLGMVRQWQDCFYEHRLAESVFEHQPKFKLLAQAYDLDYVELNKEQNLEKIVKSVFATNRPTLVNVSIPKFEEVYPMIVPGHSNNEMIGVD